MASFDSGYQSHLEMAGAATIAMRVSLVAGRAKQRPGQDDGLVAIEFRGHGQAGLVSGDGVPQQEEGPRRYVDGEGAAMAAAEELEVVAFLEPQGEARGGDTVRRVERGGEGGVP